MPYVKFYMVDDRLEDWSKRGDICAVTELSSDRERPFFGVLDKDQGSQSEHQEVNGSIVPFDAFRDSESIQQEGSFFGEPSEEKGFFSNLFSDEEEVENQEGIPYITENQNRVFIGNGVPFGREYQNDDLNYMDIPADAF